MIKKPIFQTLIYTFLTNEDFEIKKLSLSIIIKLYS